MSRIIALADAYAAEQQDWGSGSERTRIARAALEAEVERTERRVFDMRVIFDAACTERDALRAELETVRKDAARYRWLRTNMDDSVVMYGNVSEAMMMGEEELDAAIDAAMEATK